MEEKDTQMMPELTLEVPEAPVLTLEVDEETATKEAEIGLELLPDTQKLAPMPDSMEDSLSPEEKEMVSNFAEQIDLTNSTHILNYGVASQKKMVSFSESTLSAVKGKDLGEVGSVINNLVSEIKTFNPDQEEKSGFLGMFKKPKKLEKMQIEYSSVEKNIDGIVRELETHQRILLKDVTMLDKMYDMNLAYYKELTLYIIAGKKRLAQAEQVELPALKQKAELSGSAQDAQAMNDFSAQINRFDKKLHDLELTRNISLQMGPQIRMVQNNNAMMVEKIQSSIVNTIPLWKNQMVLTLGLAHSEQAIAAQRAVTDTTNQLLRSNADKLKTSTINSAKESERGIVDIETLQHSNQALISTLDEVLKIQQEGYQKRRDAEIELQRIENELKTKLLESRDLSTSNLPPQQ